MRSLLISGWVGLCFALAGSSSLAATLAGTSILNRADVGFELAAQPGQRLIQSNDATFRVQEMVDVAVRWKDPSPIGVSSPDAQRVLEFEVTNLGNAAHSFSVATAPGPGGDWAVEAPSAHLYRESGGQPGLQTSGPNADTVVLTSQALVLEPRTTTVIYVAADIPEGAALGSLGAVSLALKSTSPGLAGLAPGSVLKGRGLQGVDQVVGLSGGAAQAAGLYRVTGTAVTTEKTVISVADKTGGSRATPGAVLTYQIAVRAQGTGSLTGLVIEDVLPAELSLVPGSLTVDGAAWPNQSSAPDGVRVDLGDRSPPFGVQIRFRAQIR